MSTNSTALTPLTCFVLGAGLECELKVSFSLNSHTFSMRMRLYMVMHVFGFGWLLSVSVIDFQEWPKVRTEH